jgi:hypothetical protein
MRANRYLVLIIPLVLFFLLELFYFFPSLIYVSITIGLFLIFWTLSDWTKKSEEKKDWWNYMILPSLFFLSSVGISVILINSLLIHLLFFFCLVFIYSYFKNIFYLISGEDNIKGGFLENISFYGNFIIIYFFASMFFGLKAYLNISISLTVIAFLPIVVLSAYQVFWHNGFEVKKMLIFVFLIGMILTEIMWASAFLSLNHFILGFLMAIVFYILTGLTRFYLRGVLTYKNIKLYLLFGLSSLFLIMLTARWI